MRFASPRMDSSITMSTMPPVSFSIDPHDENDVGCCKGRFCRKRMVILAGKEFQGDCVEGNRTSNQQSCRCYWNDQGRSFTCLSFFVDSFIYLAFLDLYSSTEMESAHFHQDVSISFVSITNVWEPIEMVPSNYNSLLLNHFVAFLYFFFYQNLVYSLFVCRDAHL
ncbi:uncharacterized protein LOC121975086 isoform X1 [Zingiber officinale]|uniref:uncharacterized protein LOC121975086 isoform X1 n=1 Tax=Zingiber officinale TaxID=94328 RepID=UPI001C4B225B|nr:uncharacterized protein LOC121975086 isoform X1 [Zingiber officinale]